MGRNHDPKFLEQVLNNLLPGVKFTVDHDVSQLAFVIDVVIERAFSMDSLEIKHNIGPGSNTELLERLLLMRLEYIATRLQNNIKLRRGE